MGIPYFFTWLSKRYPLSYNIVGDQLPIVDCLYMDMNGIIYKMVREQNLLWDQINSKDFDAIWSDIVSYTQQIINLIRPTSLIYIGFDGVAPRAKMNNQRQRRFRAGNMTQKVQQIIRNCTKQQGKQKFITNSISPGTQFTMNLNKNFQYYISHKIKTDSQWRKRNIIFSGTDSPGQCQHKILQYIRQSIKFKQFNQNHLHCIYGADSDLIMLSLSLSLPNIMLLREQYKAPQKHKSTNPTKRNQNKIEFGTLMVSTLRQYMQLEWGYLKNQMKIEYDLARIIDDFVLVSFFIGNDFLPRIYCFNIHQGNFQNLIQLFKQFLSKTDSYIHDKGIINWHALLNFLRSLKDFQQKFIDERLKQIIYQNKSKHGITNIYCNYLIEQPLKKEQEFLKLFSQTLKKNPIQAKKLFYLQKMMYDINSEQGSNKLTQIILQYINGIQFVIKYYYKGCPSWEWYYPHFYSPLISDIYLLLNQKLKFGTQITNLSLGQPFQPFKQLFSIIPQYSFKLLPQCMWQLFQNPNSIIHKPKNYFPAQYILDSYGCFKQYQFIPLIPFLDDQILQKSYKITSLSLEQKIRNRKIPPRRFAFNFNSNLIIKSFVSHQDQQFPVQISNNIHYVLKKRQNLTHIQSLSSLRIQNVELKKLYRHWVLFLKLEVQQQDIKIDQDIQYGVPFNQRGYVLNIYKNDVNKKDRIKLQKQGIQIQKIQQESVIVKIRKLRNLKRNFYGNLVWNYNLYQQEDNIYIFSRLIRKLNQQKKYFFKNQIIFKGLTDQFQQDQSAIILGGQYKGSKGYICTTSQDKVILYIVNPDFNIHEYKHNFQSLYDKSKFYSLKDLSKALNINIEVFLIILERFQIQLDRQHPDFNPLFPKLINIGLNLIDRGQLKLVSSLCRISKLKQGQRYYMQKQFRNLQISQQTVKLLFNYIQNFSDIIKKINPKIHKIHKVQELGITNNRVIQIYAWVMKQKQSYLPFTSLFSRSTNSQRIKLLSQIWSNQNKLFINHIKNRDQNQKNWQMGNFQALKKISVDPNYVMTKYQADLAMPYLIQQPYIHRIGDKVICLKRQVFGMRGVIVGYDQDKFQVFFQQKSFGLNNLCGKCQILRGRNFKMIQLFNLDCWDKFLIRRSQLNPQSSWNGIIKRRQKKPLEKILKATDFLQSNVQLAKIVQNNLLQNQNALKRVTQQLANQYNEIKKSQQFKSSQQVLIYLKQNREQVKQQQLEQFRGIKLKEQYCRNQNISKEDTQLLQEAESLGIVKYDKFRNYSEKQINFIAQLKRTVELKNGMEDILNSKLIQVSNQQQKSQLKKQLRQQMQTDINQKLQQLSQKLIELTINQLEQVEEEERI